MDFMMALPQSSHGFDVITVFIDQLTKMVHLVPGHTTDTAPIVATQFLNHVFKLHGLPSRSFQIGTLASLVIFGKHSCLS